MITFLHIVVLGSKTQVECSEQAVVVVFKYRAVTELGTLQFCWRVLN